MSEKRDPVHTSRARTELQSHTGLILGFGLWRSQMAAAIARALSRVSRIDLELETLKIIALFCGVGLLISLLMATNGLDLSVGFF